MKFFLIGMSLLAMISTSHAAISICEAGGMAKANGYGSMALSIESQHEVEFLVHQDGQKLEGSLSFKYEQNINDAVKAKLFLGKIKVEGSLLKREVPLVVFLKNDIVVAAKISIRNISDGGRTLPTSSEDLIKNLLADFSCK